MDALYANVPTTARRITCAFKVAQLLLIMVIFSASAQEFLHSRASTQNMLNNEISQTVNSARRFTRYGNRRNSFRTKTNCRNSVECDSNQRRKSSDRPKVTYVDAYRTRALQCTEFNKKTYNGKNINWKPYLNAFLDECKLYCMASGQKFYARLKDAVNDGTPCGKDYSNVCIKGKCQKRPKGCETIEGPCLVDRGKKVLGVFNNTQLDTGYNFVATIPAGATNVSIEELTRSRSYLALKDHSSNTYRLNGHWMISLSKTFQLDNSRVTYARDGSTRRGGELITIDGPLANSLDLMVIYQREPSVIMYSYFINEEEYEKIKSQPRKEGQNVYFPERGRYSQPAEKIQNDERASQTSEGESISFMGGQEQPSYSNKDEQNFGNPNAPRGQGYPDGQRKQDKQITYGSSWVQFGGDENSQQKQISGPDLKVAKRPFLNQQVYKPNQFDKSRSLSYPRPHWGSKESGDQFGGSQTGSENRDRVWPNRDVKTFYTSNQERNRGREGYIWKIVGFTPCSSPCAGGIQSGIVKCTHATTGEIVQDTNCNFEARPQETRRVCNLPPCPAKWAPQEWHACSKSCGEGQQVRDLMCEQTIDRNGEKVNVMLPVVKCPVHLRPEVIRKCFIKECPELPKAKWAVQNWGECSVECGHGVQKRNIACKDYKNETVDDSNCLWTRKPIVLKACYMGMCKADWYFRSAWSQCSRTCGGGYRSRPVVCARIEGSKLAESHCEKKKKPEYEQSCNTQHCKGIWVTSEWSKCSTDCGRGIQQRVVICMKSVNGNYQETFDAECSLDDKPAVRKDCSSNCPPGWFATPWTSCSVSCGHGVETRHVSCLNDEGKRVGGCKAWERPQLRRACYPKACPGTNPSKSKVPSTCKDNPPRSFKRYCHIIKRINYCRIPSYRKRCCATCATEDTVMGHM